MDKHVSIIIATYNSEHVISRCLDSIVNQKTEQIELIIVDGDSSDRTLERIRAFGNSVDTVISEPDFGIYDAWNKGLKAATGQWIMFVGSDDQLLPGALAQLVSLTYEHPNVHYIAPQINMTKNDGTLVRAFGEPFVWSRFRKNMNLAHVSALHNRALFENYGKFDPNYKICGDYEILLRVGKDLSVHFEPSTTAIMQVGGKSQSDASAIFETRTARLVHNSMPRLFVEFHFITGLLKFYLRSIMVRP